MAKRKNINRSAIVDAIAEAPKTARELADRFGVAVESMRVHLDALSLHNQVRAVGRRGKKEIVWGTAQVTLGGVQDGRHLPMLIPGRGERDHTCVRNETGECLDRFDRAHPNYEGPARCPKGCSHFRMIPNGYWREYATEGRGTSQAASCEMLGGFDASPGYSMNRTRGTS